MIIFRYTNLYQMSHCILNDKRYPVHISKFSLDFGLGGTTGIGLQTGFPPASNLLNVQALLPTVLGQFGLIQ